MKTKFIIFTVVVILFVVGLGVFTNKAQGPGKYDEFAIALKDRGAVFYGAFWCPHCQDQKEAFGSSKKLLPYVECSNPNKSPTQICTDEKIESFPTWKFKDGVIIASEIEPTVCEPRPGKEGEPEICKNSSSALFKTWFFPGEKFSIKSPTDPINKDGVWEFESNSQVVGNLPLEFLAGQIGYTLPVEAQ